MQVKKENTKMLIIEAARKEFFEKGFKDSSMRKISKESGVTLSNIYNYFKNKNEILECILTPSLKIFDQLLKEHNKPEFLTIEVFDSALFREESTELLLKLVVSYKDELNLLLFKSAGSQYENFVSEYNDKHESVGSEYLKMMKQRYPHLNINVSSFFIHTISSWWLTCIGEIVSHDLQPNEIKQFVDEYMTFCTAGWKKIMEA